MKTSNAREEEMRAKACVSMVRMYIREREIRIEGDGTDTHSPSQARRKRHAHEALENENLYEHMHVALRRSLKIQTNISISYQAM